MRAEGLFVRLSAIGTAAQASVPGVYAWGVTVAPAAFARGAPGVAKGAALVALVMLGAGAVSEPRWVGRARIASLWGFVIACAVSWAAAPAGLSPFRIDAARGLAGLLGWALFAFASAAPSLQTAREGMPPTRSGSGDSDGLPSSPREGSLRGDAAYIVGAAALAAMLQAVGWRIASAERALLVRFIALASGLAVIGAATEIALERRALRTAPSNARRFRRTLAPLVALGILALVGVLNVVLD
jgi:hypothetical protein